jgi:hypothetical protein
LREPDLGPILGDVDFARFAAIYATGWFLTAAYFVVGMYRRKDMANFESALADKLQDDPELAAHFEDDVHGSRTKVRMLLAIMPIFLLFALASLWPAVWGLKLATALRR